MKVAILLLEGMRSYDVAIAAETFASGRADAAPRNDVVLVGPQSPVHLAGGLSTPVDELNALADAELILIPGFEDLSTAIESFEQPAALAAIEALRSRHHAGVEIASLCTGAFLLARTGLLDGTAATTHWRYAEDLAKLHPAVRIDPRVIYLHDAQRRLWSSAGVTAGVDLCLAILRHRYGAAAAAIVARSMVLPGSRSGGQAQFIPPRSRDRDLPGTEFDLLRQAVTTDLAAPWPLAKLSSVAGVSPRTLQRRFAELSLSPSGWLIEQRVTASQELLESTHLSVEQVASRVGFGSADLLRKHFSRAVSVSPSRYRESFQRLPDDDEPSEARRSRAG
jgi:AraC family transcriptional regulator, transcriptional activator FtrA